MCDLDIRKIRKGDIVEIEWRNLRVKGEVISATNYGSKEKSDWYIEFRSDVGYIYWKESVDGGRLVGVTFKDW